MGKRAVKQRVFDWGYQLRQSVRLGWQWVRFGTITSKVMDTISGVVCEVAYYGRGGQMIGYWAYGSWDPAFPYRG